MKINRPDPVFEPVMVTFENKNEYKLFIRALIIARDNALAADIIELMRAMILAMPK